MSFSGYIMSVVGVMCLSTLVEVFIADGETKKYVKGITALLVFVVIISPVPSFVNADFSLADFVKDADGDNDVAYDNFSFATEQSICDRKEALCVELLKANGYGNVGVTLIFDYSRTIPCVDKAVADFTVAVISPEKRNIDITSDVTRIVADSTGVDREDVIITGLNYE